jgi:hypothetical protein
MMKLNQKYSEFLNEKWREDNLIFVFGSNTKGWHGAGSALQAKLNWGAVQGVGEGLQGLSYALPTKTTPGSVMSFERLRRHVQKFMDTVREPTHQDKFWLITCVGCGLAGFRDHEVAPLFRDICTHPNAYFDTNWQGWLEPETKYWGTFSR